ncbi:MAG: SDR family oxidoreductase [Desulfobacteraceae bacterium]|nr:SDR family oxidoreductase [Desulfobacteraceae bacterium]
MENEIYNRFSLQGKVALVTGASRGIGECIAQTYAQAGAKVILASRKQEGIDKAAARITESGGEAIAVAANVSNGDERNRAIAKSMEWAGRIDILVNNAGTNPAFGPLADVSESAWDKIFAVNLDAALFLSQLAYKAWMKDNGGAIINTASVGAYQTSWFTPAYNITKAALVHLTACLANEWGHMGIRVNAIAPGLIRTDLSRALWENPEAAKRIKSLPIPRLGEVEDLAGAVLFLASDASAFLTGQTLVVDGGQLVHSL